MADTADLVVLGAFYGQGSKGRCAAGFSQRSVCSRNCQGFPVPGLQHEGGWSRDYCCSPSCPCCGFALGWLAEQSWAVAQCRALVQLCEWPCCHPSQTPLTPKDTKGFGSEKLWLVLWKVWPLLSLCRWHDVHLPHGLLRPQEWEVVHGDQVLWWPRWRHPGTSADRAGHGEDQQGERGEPRDAQQRAQLPFELLLHCRWRCPARNDSELKHIDHLTQVSVRAASSWRRHCLGSVPGTEWEARHHLFPARTKFCWEDPNFYLDFWARCDWQRQSLDGAVGGKCWGRLCSGGSISWAWS